MTVRVGCVARRILTQEPVGKVIAVFDRSAYLEVGAELVCLGAPGLPEGPLMVPCPMPSALRAGTRYAPEFGGATVWYPPVARAWTTGTLRVGLRSFTERAARDVPSHGLGGFAVPEPSEGPLAAVARGPAGRLSLWFENCFAGECVPVPEVNDLVGLGPGLTPSGDDFLGGAIIATHALNRPDIAAALFAALDLSRTNRISAAHLSAAGEGAASAPLHDLLNDVLCGIVGGLPSRLAGLRRMGQSSGWDGFAGCSTALQAYLNGYSSYAMSDENGVSSFACPPRKFSSMIQAQARTSPPT